MRRWMATLVALALLGGAVGACAESIAFNGENYAVLLDVGGSLFTPRGTYAGLYRLSDEDCPEERVLFSATPMDVPPGMPGGRCALMDAGGALLTAAEYDYFQHFDACGTVVFSKDGWLGAMNERGEVILEAEFSVLWPNGRGGFLAMTGARDERDLGTLLYIDSDGVRTEKQRDVLPWYTADCNGERTAVAVLRDGEACYGYVDAQGAWAIEPQFVIAESFRDGYACVCGGDGRYGLIDRDGNYALAPEYDSLDYQYGEGPTFSASRGNVIVFLDRESLAVVGEYAAEGVDWAYASECNPGMFLVQAGRDSGTVTRMFDMDARLLFEQTEQEALVNLNGYYATCEGLPGRIVRSEGEWPETQCWLIDLEGEAVAGPYQQLDAASWRDGEGRYIVSSFDTNTVTEAGQTWSYPVYSSYRYGVVDQDGAQVLPCRYASIYFLSEGLYAARLGEISGVIDESGSWIFRMSDFEELQD